MAKRPVEKYDFKAFGEAIERGFDVPENFDGNNVLSNDRNL